MASRQAVDVLVRPKLIAEIATRAAAAGENKMTVLVALAKDLSADLPAIALLPDEEFAARIRTIIA